VGCGGLHSHDAWLVDIEELFMTKDEALAEQPAQQKPVGTYGEIFESMRSLLRSGRQADQQIYMAMQHKPLYTSPPAAKRQWVGLTDEEVMQTMSGDWTSQFYFARAIEAKLKEKNT
jgi:hypothetical protein